MNWLKGKKVIITGAASGIGFCTAEEFARAGSTLIISDINEKALAEAVTRLKKYNIQVYPYTVDISRQDQVEEMINDVLENIGEVDVLINNAGIGHNGEIVETSLETWKKLMDVNFWGALYHIYALLPHMVKNKRGHIVNVSSGQAFFRLPTWGVYATIKIALGAFSEMLYFETRKFNLTVTTVYPFMVNTPFYKNIPGDTYFSQLAMKLVPYYSNSPETVARKIYRAVYKKERIEMVNFLNSIGFLTQAIPPLGTVVSTVTSMFLGKSVEKVQVASLHS